MKNKLYIIKIGGNLIDNEQSLDMFLANFAKLDAPKLLVHGGGKLATKLSTQLGVGSQMVDGRRVTSTENLEVVTMVYAGLINKKISAKLQSLHCNAMGISGADANSIVSVKRDPVPINYGWVGDIKEVNTSPIRLFLNNGITPVYCAITHDGQGQLLNTNADTIAADLAIAMSKSYHTELTYCFEKKGVLADLKDDNSVISTIDWKKYQELKAKGTIDKGMLPKMENCFHALRKNVAKVVIGNAQAIANAKSSYTTLKLSPIE